MADLHAAMAVLLVVATLLFFLLALWCARTGRHEAALEKGRVVLNALVGVQVLVGALLFGAGSRPAETLHFLYGFVALVALPAARAFAAEAPFKGRAASLAAGSGLMLIMLWRLWVTGGA